MKERILSDGTVIDELGNFKGIDQPSARPLSQDAYEIASAEVVVCLTRDEWMLLRGLVSHAAHEESERVSRMEDRVTGFHSPEKMQLARDLAADMASLERAVESAASREP